MIFTLILNLKMTSLMRTPRRVFVPFCVCDLVGADGTLFSSSQAWLFHHLTQIPSCGFLAPGLSLVLYLACWAAVSLVAG